MTWLYFFIVLRTSVISLFFNLLKTVLRTVGSPQTFLRNVVFHIVTLQTGHLYTVLITINCSWNFSLPHIVLWCAVSIEFFFMSYFPQTYLIFLFLEVWSCITAITLIYILYERSVQTMLISLHSRLSVILTMYFISQAFLTLLFPFSFKLVKFSFILESCFARILYMLHLIWLIQWRHVLTHVCAFDVILLFSHKMFNLESHWFLLMLILI